MFKRHKRLIIWSVVLLLLTGAGAAGYMLAANEPRVVEATPEPSEVPAGAENVKVEKGANILWAYEYNMCSHSIHINAEADDDMAGLSFSEFQTKFPYVRIVSFEPYKLELKMSFDCYCPAHYILKRHGDGLAVFRTMPGTDEQEVYRNIALRFDDIEEDEKSALEAGKLFDSIDALDKYLENIDTS